MVAVEPFMEALRQVAEKELEPSDLSTICFYSATTVTPQGIMLTPIITHSNVIAVGDTMDFFKNSGIFLSDTIIRILPLAQMLERVVESVCFIVGARVGVGYYREDVRTLADDIAELRPTVVPAVLRVLQNRPYDKEDALRLLPLPHLMYKARQGDERWRIRTDEFGKRCMGQDRLPPPVQKKIRSGTSVP